MTERESVRALLLRFAEEETGVAAAEIDMAKSPAEMGIDSLSFLEAMSALEDALGARVPDKGLSNHLPLSTIAQVIESALEEET